MSEFRFYPIVYDRIGTFVCTLILRVSCRFEIVCVCARAHVCVCVCVFSKIDNKAKISFPLNSTNMIFRMNSQNILNMLNIHVS